MSAFNSNVRFTENKVALKVKNTSVFFFFFTVSGIQWSRKSDVIILTTI